MIRLVGVLLLAGSSALAQPLPARDTADVGARNSWSVGVFNPLRWSIRDGVELEAQPLVALVSPHVSVRVAHLSGRWRVAGEYGLGVPTFGMRLLGDLLFPSWDPETSGDRIGWALVPSVGAVVSTGERGVFTARAQLAIGIPLGRNDANPLDAYAPVDLAFAPALTGLRARIGAQYDHPLTERLRLRGGADVWATGANPAPARSPLFLSAWAGLDVGVGASSRFTAGLRWFNSDQRRTRLVQDAEGFSTRQRVRSNDVFPTLDFIWAG